MKKIDIDLVKLGKNIRLIRNELNLSQEDFAHRVDIHRTYISGLERGLRNPTFALLIKLSKKLKIDINKLFQGIL